MSTSVGTIDLGLDISQKQFNRQLSGIARGAEGTVRSAFKGLGKYIAGALSIAAVTKFTKSCIDMGSNLSEVQNVVDVTFGSMREEINKFAKTAITQFGISETAAKRYTSTIGAMLKSMGIGAQQAVKMSQVTAGLAADMASFYNLDAEDAFYKIRAGISGETEPLKQLGINLSVANLEAYALAKGITKSYSKMSQSEQVLLRYNYLLEVTKDAQGDFARTSDSWANQTRILTMQFEALKATLGQAFISLLTPVVKMLNSIISKLSTVANYFNSFVQAAFGKSDDSVTTGATQASTALEGIGDSTEDAVKKAKKALAGFDEVNTLADSNAEDVGDMLGGLDDLDVASMPDITQPADDVEKIKDALNDISEKVKPLKNLFKEMNNAFKCGFSNPLKNMNFDSIKSGLNSIKDSFKYIFSNKDLQQSAKNFATTFSNMLGSLWGNEAKVIINTVDSFINGFANGLEAKKEVITERLTNTFNNLSKINVNLGELFNFVGDISEVLKGQNVQRIWSDITQILIDGCTVGLDIGTRIVSDLVGTFVSVLNYNKPAIFNAVDGTFGVIANVFDILKGLVDSTCKSLYSAYNTHIVPAFEHLKSLLSEVLRIILDAYNKYILPVVNDITKLIDESVKQHVSPCIDAIIDVLGQLIESVMAVLDHFTPLLEFLKELLVPFFMSGLKGAIQMIIDVFNIVVDVIKDVMVIFKGLIQFLEGAFTGNWSKCWEGIKNIFKGIWYGIRDIALGVLKTIGDAIINGFKNVKTIFDSIKGMLGFNVDVNDDNENPDTPKPPSRRPNPVNTANLPHYGNGGIINTPQLAVLGEGHKKEAVVPLENTAWMDAMAIKMANAMQASNGYNSGGNAPTTLVIEMDGREVAKATVPYIPEQSRRLGVNLNG